MGSPHSPGDQETNSERASNELTSGRLDVVSAALLGVATLITFGLGAPRLGFYADDASFLAGLSHVHSWDVLWRHMRSYVPGRNLHPMWDWLVYRLVGEPIDNLAALHWIQSTLDGLVVVAFYLLLRRLAFSPASSLLAAGVFAFWPIHGETHFWLASMPMNVVSTLLALVFAAVTVSPGQPGPWRYSLGLAAFAGSVFTYEQVLIPLLVLVAVRPRRLLRHAPHLAIAGGSVWFRLTRGTGPLPQWDARSVASNIRETFSAWAGRLGFESTEPLVGNSTVSDRIVALLIALAIAGFAFYLSRRVTSAAPRWRVLAIAAAAFIGAYVPIWLWHISPRHHYLPSVPLFVMLAWVVDRARRPAAAFVVLGAGIWLGVSAGRGESGFWEAAYAAKRALFAELDPHLTGRNTLILSGFPLRLGPAPLIVLHDTQFTPRLLSGVSLRGHLGYAPAPSGRFLATQSLDGPGSFYYSTDPETLIVRFTGWEQGRLGFAINPPSSPAYEAVSSACLAQVGPFVIRHSSARFNEGSLELSLDFDSGSWLSAIVEFPHWGRWDTWGTVDSEHFFNVWPLLLSEADRSCKQTMRLRTFPRVDRIRLSFYRTDPGQPSSLLRQLELSVLP